MMVGTLDVEGMLRGITAKQFQGWVHFMSIEPFTFDRELRADFRTASIVQMIANVNRGKGTARQLKEFLLNFDGTPQKKQTWQEQKALAIMIAKMFNAGTPEP